MKRLVMTALLLLLNLVIAPDHAAAPRKTTEPYRLTAMRAILYSARQNRFLDEVPDDGGEFWNELNLSVFVTIEVSGTPGSYVTGRRVEVTATEGTHLILRRIARLGVIDEATGKYYVPIWLYGPFCQRVTLRARLLGQRRTSPWERKFNFACGE